MGIRSLSCWYGLLPLLAVSCSGGAHDTPGPTSPIPSVQSLSFQVINVFPHDSTSFTEGLELHDSLMYEGTGLHGVSALLVYHPETGKVVKKVSLDKTYFGEGITLLGDQLYELTLDEHKFFVYHLPDLALLRTGTWPHAGWGLTNDGVHLIASDGSDKLYLIDPSSFTETGHLSVTDEHGPLDSLNELEYVGGYIYANRWYNNHICRIDAHTGKVDAQLDATDLFQRAGIANQTLPEGAVLNGIAYSKERKTFFVTGKYWPKTFELALY